MLTPPPPTPFTLERARRIHRVFLGLRLIAIVFPFVGIVVFALVGTEAWRLAFFAGLLALTFAFHYLGWRWNRRRPFSSTELAWHVFGSLLIGMVAVYLTGAIESPIFPLKIGMSPVLAFVIGDLTPVLWLLAAQLSIIWSLVALVATDAMPQVTPAAFGLAVDFSHDVPYIWIKLALASLGMCLLTVIGLAVRRAIDGLERTAEEARRVTVEAMVRRNNELVSLSSTLAHELKNPLTAIQGLAQLMLREAAPGSKPAERFEILHREARRMAAVLEDLRTFSRPLVDLAPAATDLATLARETFLLHEALAHGRGIELTLRDRPVVAEVDAHRVLQAYANLVQNAIEACGRGDRIELSVRPLPDGGGELAVDDSGPGFPPKLVQHGPTLGGTSKPKGSGIGLVVARAIAREHRGELILADRAGQRGAHAALRLPGPPGPMGSPA